MKLYTEEQAKYFFECGRNFQMNGEVTFSDAQKEITPIELPSDEEIGYKGEWLFNNAGHTIFTHYNTVPSWVEGAKWVIEQIKQQGNG